jgi:hypothetical protein
MFSWIIQISLISIILIFLVHHLINFFKTTLTVPKIKDLVHSPNQKYKDIFDTISNANNNNTIHINNGNSNSNSNINSNNNYTSIDLLPTDMSNTLPISIDNSSSIDNYAHIKSSSMKNELKTFLKKQMKIEPQNKLNNLSPF